jgi:molybdopterin synthase catalytic subunit
MSMRVQIDVQVEDFDAGVEIRWLRAAGDDVGAVVNFIGTVSVSNEGQVVTALELEHYPGMTEKSIGAIIDAAAQRWELHAARVVHRVGLLTAGEQIVFVGVAARHRGAAFAACEFIMDYLKTRAPFWKKERTENGARWLDARASDTRAATRWER